MTQQVMVVDDDPEIRETIVEILSLLRIGALTAGNTGECLRVLREGFRGLIFMDVLMPEKNGWDTIREIERAGLLPGNIFVMLTGLNSPDEQMEGLQEFVVDYIRKPFTVDELTAAVRTYCGYLRKSQTSRG